MIMICAEVCRFYSITSTFFEDPNIEISTRTFGSILGGEGCEDSLIE